MEHYVAERYLAGPDDDRLAADAARVRAAACDASSEGSRVRFVQTVYLPGDEVCFYLFESDCCELVERVARLAELDVERILPAVALVER
jgi:hypothetical protein